MQVREGQRLIQVTVKTYGKYKVIDEQADPEQIHELFNSALKRYGLSAFRECHINGYNLAASFLDNPYKLSFEDTDIRGTMFANCDLQNLSFKNSQCNGTTFLYCNMKGADFYGTDLTNTKFIACEMDDDQQKN